MDGMISRMIKPKSKYKNRQSPEAKKKTTKKKLIPIESFHKKIWNYTSTKQKRGLHWPLLIPRLWRITVYEMAEALWARLSSGQGVVHVSWRTGDF